VGHYTSSRLPRQEPLALRSGGHAQRGLTDSYTASYVPEVASMALDPGWALPAAAGRYAGLVPSGRVYILPVQMSETDPQAGPPSDRTEQRHVAIVNGAASSPEGRDGQQEVVAGLQRSIDQLPLETDVMAGPVSRLRATLGFPSRDRSVAIRPGGTSAASASPDRVEGPRQACRRYCRPRP
jgi:hypothetical protein